MCELIAQLNDRFRQGDRSLGKYVKTPGVQALPPEKQLQLLRSVQQFDSFTKDNDSYGEHDFGKVLLDGEAYYFKMDCYDLTFTSLSQDPASPNATRRVLTVMCMSEY